MSASEDIELGDPLLRDHPGYVVHLRALRRCGGSDQGRSGPVG